MQCDHPKPDSAMNITKLLHMVQINMYSCECSHLIEDLKIHAVYSTWEVARERNVDVHVCNFHNRINNKQCHRGCSLLNPSLTYTCMYMYM